MVIGNGVTSIGGSAFQQCSNLTSVTLGAKVNSMGAYAFGYCSRVTGFYFRGNPFSIFPVVFFGDDIATVYYIVGSWEPTFGGLPTALWIEQVQVSMGNVGVRMDEFGFTIVGTSNLVFVVETCMDLANPVWSPASTNTLTSGSSYFSDPQWTNHPTSVYRIRSL